MKNANIAMKNENALAEAREAYSPSCYIVGGDDGRSNPVVDAIERLRADVSALRRELATLKDSIRTEQEFYDLRATFWHGVNDGRSTADDPGLFGQKLGWIRHFHNDIPEITRALSHGVEKFRAYHVRQVFSRPRKSFEPYQAIGPMICVKVWDEILFLNGGQRQARSRFPRGGERR
ncbi:MAG: hypothetical protein ACYCOU_04180 [Sulfobacillus sp.]